MGDTVAFQLAEEANTTNTYTVGGADNVVEIIELPSEIIAVPGATGADGADGNDGADGAGAAPVQDEGDEVVATPIGFNFVGDGVVVTDVGGVATVTIAGGGTPPTPPRLPIRAMSGSQLTTRSPRARRWRVLLVPVMPWQFPLMLEPSMCSSSRPATEGVVTAVYIYADGSPNTQNQISSWTEIASLDVSGVDHVGIYSTDPLNGAGGLIIEVV